MGLFDKLPQGIRNNNPGNLRSGVRPGERVEVVKGFARFPSMQHGCAELLDLIMVYYNGHGLKTPTAFVARYAPASENDVLAYTNVVCDWLRIPHSLAGSRDMGLDHLWPALDLARAIVHVECGRPATSWKSYPEWVSVQQWLVALNLLTGWDDETWTS